jgi:DNA-binding GntR family transcriptional regulator
MLPANLSLADLSRHYGVSITPVRDAMQALVSEGFILKLDSRRMEINPEKIGTGGSDLVLDFPKGPAEWDEVLLDEVMFASLSLVGVYLREGPLAEKYQVGRSIIRGTFGRYAGAGLLEHVPHRGWRVHPFREEDMDDYLAVREVLELMALDLACPYIKRSEIVALLDSENHALNNAIHLYIIDKSGNRYIADFFKQFVARYYTKLFYYAAPEASVVDEMTSQHQTLLETLLVEDWEKARKVLSHHIRAQKTVLEKLLVKDRGHINRRSK